MKRVWILMGLMVIIIVACNNNIKQDNQKSTENDLNENFKIEKIEPYETTDKAQVKCWAYLTIDTINKDVINSILLRIYSELMVYNNFEKHKYPDYFVVYLFTSKNKIISDPGQWIAMLSRTPENDIPEIIYDERKIEVNSALKNEQKTKDDIKVEEINEYLNKRNSDLCSLYYKLSEIEDESISTAKKKFPYSEKDRNDYQQKLYKNEKKKLFNDLNVADSMSSYIIVYGMSYCK